MHPNTRLAVAFGFLALSSGGVLGGPGQKCSKLYPISTPQLAAGYRAKLLARDLTNPRSMVFDAAGNLLVVEGGVGVRRFKMTEVHDDDDTGIGACVLSSDVIIDNREANHGITTLTGFFGQPGNAIAVSTVTDVYAYPYDASNGVVGREVSLVAHMWPLGNAGHKLTTYGDCLVVSAGSGADMDPHSMDEQSRRGFIQCFPMFELNLTHPMSWHSPASIVLAWGLRNPLGIATHPVTNELWSVDDSLRNAWREGIDISLTNPGDELNFHGNLEATLWEDYQRPKYSYNYGYPKCLALWNETGVAGLSSGPDSPRVGMQVAMAGGPPDPDGGSGSGNNYGEDGTYQSSLGPYDSDEWCTANATEPRLTFAARSSPLDLAFNGDGTAAYVAFHGGDNITPGTGYYLGRIDFGKDGQPEAAPTSKDAVVPVMWNGDLDKCPGECFRPTALAWDDKGRLYMTSSETGELFVVTVP